MMEYLDASRTLPPTLCDTPEHYVTIGGLKKEGKRTSDSGASKGRPRGLRRATFPRLRLCSDDEACTCLLIHGTYYVGNSCEMLKQHEQLHTVELRGGQVYSASACIAHRVFPKFTSKPI
jgi:hypothetical protein